MLGGEEIRQANVSVYLLKNLKMLLVRMKMFALGLSNGMFFWMPLPDRIRAVQNTQL